MESSLEIKGLCRYVLLTKLLTKFKYKREKRRKYRLVARQSGRGRAQLTTSPRIVFRVISIFHLDTQRSTIPVLSEKHLKHNSQKVTFFVLSRHEIAKKRGERTILNLPIVNVKSQFLSIKLSIKLLNVHFTQTFLIN